MSHTTLMFLQLLIHIHCMAEITKIIILHVLHFKIYRQADFIYTTKVCFRLNQIKILLHGFVYYVPLAKIRWDFPALSLDKKMELARNIIYLGNPRSSGWD